MSESVITFDILNAVNYGKELKAKFEEIGVGPAWKNGAKKKDLINSALKMLAEVKALKEAGDEIDQDSIDKALVLKEAKDKEDEEKRIVDQKIIDDKKVEDDKESVRSVYSSFSIEQLETALVGIEGNLKMNIQSQRRILLKKKEALTIELESR